VKIFQQRNKVFFKNDFLFLAQIQKNYKYFSEFPLVFFCLIDIEENYDYGLWGGEEIFVESLIFKAFLGAVQNPRTNPTKPESNITI
jgi:hypothetical protein